ncbi:hypothetical protein [Actinoplanes sp. NBRC 103695]|uniref:hypothetical protein n=1 Tax=Actinoplanes sp. NBRC 103695 TaxID=3032202 RepID=UPI0024A2D534|nr:hypothetical protein [Actinoplanes sp. NBRC 103695]GLY97808.1 hypothetical protein Acsp02_50620 [Actinoplanes sp. NBRC 103695]
MSADVTAPVTNAVPVVDLRHEYAGLLSYPHFNDYVRENATALVPTGELAGGIDVSCLVLVDDAAALAAHGEAFAFVLSSSAVKQVVYVAVGMADPETRTAVVLPSVLNRESVAVLWAGDPAGIAWRPDRGPDSVVRIPPPAGPGDPAPLLDLLDALRTREVFQRVVAEAKNVHTPVTAPAVRVRSNRLDERTLTAARRRALVALATGGAGDGTANARPAGRDHARPTGAPAGGRVRDRMLAAEAAVDAVPATVAAAGRWWSVFTPRAGGNVPHLAAAAAAGVKEYRAVLADLFRRLDNRGDDQRRAELRAEGITLPAGQTGGARAVEDVTRTVQQSLDEGCGLEQIVKVLHGRGANLLPMGSAARIPALDRAVEGVAEPPRMAGGLGGPPVLVLTTTASLLPALTGPPWRYACLAAFVIVVLGAVLVRGKRRHLGLTRPEAARDVFAVFAVAALAGIGLAASVVDPVVTGQETAVALVAAGLLMAVLAPVLWWRRLVRRWERSLGPAPGGLRPALDALTSLYNETTGEWSVMDARRQASNTFRTTASALDAIRAAFLSRAQQEPGGVPSRQAGAVMPAGGNAATEAIRADLSGLVQLCLAERWAEARAGDLDGLPERAARHAGDLLDEYEGHLRRHGVEEPPPGWPSRRDAEQLSWWHSGLRGVVFGHDQPAQLLCADHQAPMLSRDRRAVTIRFAPRQAWAVFTDPDQHDPVDPADVSAMVWTSTGRAAGLLHLVPLRAGVRQVQSEASSGAPSGASSGGEWTGGEQR